MTRGWVEALRTTARCLRHRTTTCSTISMASSTCLALCRSSYAERRSHTVHHRLHQLGQTALGPWLNIAVWRKEKLIRGLHLHTDWYPSSPQCSRRCYQPQDCFGSHVNRDTLCRHANGWPSVDCDYGVWTAVFMCPMCFIYLSCHQKNCCTVQTCRSARAAACAKTSTLQTRN
jgi:hypothetical protein